MTGEDSHPPKIEVIDYIIYTNGDPEAVAVETRMAETKQAKLSDFTESDTKPEVYFPPCLKTPSETETE